MLGLVLLVAQAASAEEVFLVPVLRNGDFAEVANPDIPGIPWWEVRGDGVEVVSEAPGSFYPITSDREKLSV